MIISSITNQVANTNSKSSDTESKIKICSCEQVFEPTATRLRYISTTHTFLNS